MHGTSKIIDTFETYQPALGKLSDVMVELHMTFVPVDFLIMDMGNKTSSPIIL